MNEETRNPEKTPGRAATVTVLVIVVIYMTVALATLAFAGIGQEGLGAGNPDNQGSIFAVLAGPVMGPFAILMSLAILSSSAASLQSTFVSPARTLLAMGHYKALPTQVRQGQPDVQVPELRHHRRGHRRRRCSTSSPGPRRKTRCGTPSPRSA